MIDDISIVEFMQNVKLLEPFVVGHKLEAKTDNFSTDSGKLDNDSAKWYMNDVASGEIIYALYHEGTPIVWVSWGINGTLVVYPYVNLTEFEFLIQNCVHDVMDTHGSFCF